MNYTYLWLTLGLACLLVLVLLSTATSLFLVRRLDGLSQAHDATEQRVIQLAYELRRLERLTDGMARRRGIATSSDAEEDLENAEPPPPTPLISVPDLGFEGGPQDFGGLAKKHGEIWALVDAGRTPLEIAQETGRPIGQVELIVGLYWQHHDSHKQGRHDGPR
ncbi:hypothetical protein [Planctomyces sp. SH-PL62]|uniref:hypothetical protein n=1 Tax=Planctomyces sp. SH-PL62 TaxID=1636152 RepID=UPI00078CCA34|nr:hypothetical protein [Planctomyces sp. SH-PL62]AMV39281.1 hypothetical protein VT85_17720 [Planctomyces sp. SH-PL62]